MFLYDIKPVKFHPYRSDVLKRIFSTEYSRGDEIDSLENRLRDLFNEHGIKCYRDNKIVFECEIHGKLIYYGFYDWKFSVGFDYFDESEKYKKENKHG